MKFQNVNEITLDSLFVWFWCISIGSELVQSVNRCAQVCQDGHNVVVQTHMHIECHCRAYARGQKAKLLSNQNESETQRRLVDGIRHSMEIHGKPAESISWSIPTINEIVSSIQCFIWRVPTRERMLSDEKMVKWFHIRHYERFKGTSHANGYIESAHYVQ